MALFPEELTNLFEVKDHFNSEVYGTIYRAIKRSNFYSGDGKMHAIKAVDRTSTGSSWNDIATQMQAISIVNPYKLRLDSFFVSDNTWFIVIDHCENDDLLKAIVDKIEGHGLFEEDEIWKYFIQICLGLKSLHCNGLIHQDLHPQNILLDENKDIKIADFGISGSLPTDTIQGVASYQSPRTHSGEMQTKESNIWAVGCILYYLCNLKHPFGNNKNKIKDEPHMPIRSEYSTELRNFVDWCLIKQRAERPTIFDILTNEFLVNKTLSLGITIPQTSAMNVAICKIQLNKERERNEQLEKKLSKYRKKNTAKTSEIELLKEEIAHLNSIINDNKKNEKDLKDSNEELINSQRIKITQDLIKNNEAEKAQKIQELREKRFEIWNRSNGQDLEQDFRRTCSKYSSDIYADEQAYQDYTNAYRQKTSLYTIDNDLNRTNLIIYDTENDSREVRIVDTHESLDLGTCIAQLPNGNLFCFGKDSPIISGTTLIIDENYRARELPSGTHCYSSSAIYFNNSVYCFGGINNKGSITLSERFDLNKNRWTKLKSLPQADHGCKSVMFNGNIVISGYNKHLLRYSIGKNTFAKIPYDFKEFKQKILLSAERLYLIECQNGSIYESELSSDTAWRPIGDSIINSFHQIYVSYNKGGINIALIYSVVISYFKFNLEGKILTKLDEIHR